MLEPPVEREPLGVQRRLHVMDPLHAELPLGGRLLEPLADIPHRSAAAHGHEHAAPPPPAPGRGWLLSRIVSPRPTLRRERWKSPPCGTAPRRRGNLPARCRPKDACRPRTLSGT